MLKLSFALALLVALLSPLVSSQYTPEQIRQFAREEAEALIRNIDYTAEFDRVKDEIFNFDTVWEATNIAVSPGVFVFLIVLLIMLPNLFLIGLIFLCCWGCKCGCFAYKRSSNLAQRSHAGNNAATVHSNNPLAPNQTTEKPSLMPVRSRFTKPAGRTYPSSGAPISPTGSASAYQGNNQW